MRNRAWLILLFLLLCPASAEAHSDLRMGAFAGGLLHPFETFPHLLLLVALGLRLGQHPPFRLRRFLAIFAPAVAVALSITAADDAISVPQPILIGLALFTGGLISSGLRTLRWVHDALLVLAAFAIGLDSAVINSSAMTVAKVLFANGVCLVVVVGYIAYYVSFLPERKWAQIGIRILGSWIVAISVLILAFYFKRG